MRARLRLPWLVGLVLPVVMAEVALRALAPTLPSPDPWPNVGIEVKSEQATALVGQPVDVLLLGSSVTEAGVDPDGIAHYADLSVFNGAAPYSTPISMETWLDERLWALDPAVVVVGLPIWGAPEAREADSLNNAFVTYTRSLDDDGDLGAHSALWSRRAQLRDIFGLVSDTVTAGTYTDRGHLTLYYDRNRGPAAPVVGDPFPGFSDDNVAALAEIVRTADERGAEVVLMLEPGGCPPILPGCADAGSEVEARSAVDGLAASLGVDFIDGRAFVADAAWFADDAHFNQSGTEHFTEFLAAQLSLTFAR